MRLSVQKYGGATIRDVEHLHAVARRIAGTVRERAQVVVAISAMGDETDELLALQGAVSSVRPGREIDVLITNGERKAAALLGLALQDLGIPADSFTGAQAVRGVDPALVTGAAALREYCSDDALERSSLEKGERIAAALSDLAGSVSGTEVRARGRGMAHGLAFVERPELGSAVSAAAFEPGLLVETAGPQDEVVKLLPPLTIDDDELERGLELLGDAVRAAC